MKKILWFAVCVMVFTQCKKDQLDKNDIIMDPYQVTTSHRRCQADIRMSSIYQQRPDYKKEINDGRIKMQDESFSADIRADKTVYTIPVHVIIVHRSGESIGRGTNLSDKRVFDQIKRLNQDFRRLNSDVSKTPSVFPTADSGIEFCLASVDPQGRPTNGITRYAFNGNFENRESQIKSATGWDNKRYLNIWVSETIEGLGYAYLPTPSSLPESNLDGIVVLTSTFGDGPELESSFNKGRTATHEVGHYLGLDHIWGDGCGVDDGIGDTPSQSDFNEGCPSHPSPSCNNGGDMFMNYMDYADDRCMFAFTPGQSNYMRHILSTSRKQLVQASNTSCQSGNGNPDDPTCTDGIQNGNETGIDCGGDCPPCASTDDQVDLGIQAISVEQGGCSGSVTPLVIIKNFGSKAVSGVQIQMLLNGRLASTQSYNNSIQVEQQVSIRLSVVNFVAGNNKVKVKISLAGDGNQTNNALSKDFTNNGFNTKIVIQPDDYAADIYWELWNDDTDRLIAEGGNYADFDLTRIHKKLCLPDGCYTFIIYDFYGDGLCCDYGRGWYQIKDANNNVILRSNGRYSDYDWQSFCISNGNVSASKLGRGMPEPNLKSFQKRTITKTVNSRF